MVYPSTELMFINIHSSKQQTHSLEANSRSSSQKIPRLVLNHDVHCSVHNSLPPVSVPACTKLLIPGAATFFFLFVVHFTTLSQ
jgi:hypothetical protein